MWRTNLYGTVITCLNKWKDQWRSQDFQSGGWGGGGGRGKHQNTEFPNNRKLRNTNKLVNLPTDTILTTCGRRPPPCPTPPHPTPWLHHWKIHKKGLGVENNETVTCLNVMYYINTLLLRVFGSLIWTAKLKPVVTEWRHNIGDEANKVWLYVIPLCIEMKQLIHQNKADVVCVTILCLHSRTHINNRRRSE